MFFPAGVNRVATGRNNPALSAALYNAGQRFLTWLIKPSGTYLNSPCTHWLLWLPVDHLPYSVWGKVLLQINNIRPPWTLNLVTYGKDERAPYSR